MITAKGTEQMFIDTQAGKSALKLGLKLSKLKNDTLKSNEDIAQKKVARF